MPFDPAFFWILINECLLKVDEEGLKDQEKFQFIGKNAETSQI